jgi:hypothetical protein
LSYTWVPQGYQPEVPTSGIRKAYEVFGLIDYSPDCNPTEYLWKNIKKMATHLQHFPDFTLLQVEGDKALLHFAHTPHAIRALMARYCESLGARAA